MNDAVDLLNATLEQKTEQLIRAKSNKFKLKKWYLRAKDTIRHVQDRLDAVLIERDQLRDYLARLDGDLDRLRKKASDQEVQLGQL